MVTFLVFKIPLFMFTTHLQHLQPQNVRYNSAQLNLTPSLDFVVL